MSVEKGSAFLLKVGNGDTPLTYTTIAGLRTTQLSVSGEAVNITSKDSGGWRELLSGAGVRAVSVSAAPTRWPERLTIMTMCSARCAGWRARIVG